jgi:hypothetical protein
MDRRKRIEEAASSHASVQRVGMVDPAKYYSFVAGAEWADKTNAEIPALRSALEEVVPLIEKLLRTPSDKYEHWSDLIEWEAVAKALLQSPNPSVEPPSPTTEGSEDRGT